MKNEEGKLKLRTVAVEAASIVLAVLLALAVDEWREDRSHQELADSAIRNIVIELKSNQELLGLIHVNNVETLKIMDESSEQGQEDDEQNEGRNFIPGIQLIDTAWEALMSTGTSAYIDYDTILSLSATYSMQRVYKDTGWKMTSAAMNVAAYATVLGSEVDNENFQQQFISYFRMLVDIEDSLLKSYEASIARLDQSN